MVTGLLVSFAGCQTPTQGAVTGAVVGAGTGAIIGDNSGKAGEGALIGGALGAVGGAIMGNENQRLNNQRQYAPATTPASRPVSPPPRVQQGHYETRIVTTPSGESYEERVWVPAR